MDKNTSKCDPTKIPNTQANGIECAQSNILHYWTWAETKPPLVGSFSLLNKGWSYQRSHLLNHFSPFGVMGRVHSGWRQGPPLDELPYMSICRTGNLLKSISAVLQRFSGTSSTTRTPFMLCLHWGSNFSAQFPTDWETTAQTYQKNLFLLSIAFSFSFYQHFSNHLSSKQISWLLTGSTISIIYEEHELPFLH